MIRTESRRVFEQADGTFIVNDYDARGAFIRATTFTNQEEANAFASDLSKSETSITATEEAHTSIETPVVEVVTPESVTPAPESTVEVVDGEAQAPEQVASVATEEVINQ